MTLGRTLRTAVASFASVGLAVTMVPAGGAVAETSDEETRRHVVVFAGQHAPRGFADRVASVGGSGFKSFEGIGVASVQGLSEEAVQQLRATDGVIAVERDLFLAADALEEAGAVGDAATDVVGVTSGPSPTDAQFYPRQWNLRAIGAEAAWADGPAGSPDVTAFVLDTGIDYLHPDLVSRVDLVRSISLVSSYSTEDTLVQTMFPGRHPITDLHSHGTAISGLIVSNSMHLAGVTQQTTLVGVKVHDRFRMAPISNYIEGIWYAANNRADVIHLSIPREFDKAENPGLVAAAQRALNYAHRKGAVMVAAAGNAAQMGDGDLDHDGDRFRFCNGVHVICLGATGPTAAASVNGPWTNVDAIAPYSNFGRSAIDVSGPGGTTVNAPNARVWLVCSQATVFTPLPPPNHVPKASDVCIGGGATRRIWSSTGTSFAAGATSGLASLLVSIVGKGRPDRVEALIIQTADDLGEPGTDPYYGKGRINVAEAVAAAQR